ncbi:peptidase M13 (plasmid) [Gemmatirosa kalamazoonensis]|uniref:Peptidase M13 n=1 Tax=Gemmatirosa kalamazoonensis TaxID=861299 RepID=W0RPM8_9BACT|nr:M13 family metallopeptidase [Gemmatirosa kalamazoonensis]AHG92959.1 peptidase M13 [Gemmatirosa kalamazoonensis]
MLRLALRRAALALLLAPAALRAQTTPMPPLDRANLDTTCAPCENFYKYANGGWLKRATIPAAFSGWSSFNELEERNRAELRRILETAAARAASTRDADERLLGTFYASCMDSSAAERAGADPLRPELARIDAIADRDALRAELARLHRMGVGGGLGLGAGPDAKNNTVVVVSVGQGGIGLPTKDFYTRTDATGQRARDAYLAYAARLFELAGIPGDSARADAARVMTLETALATASKSPVELRDPNASYNPMSLEALDTLAPALHAREFLAAAGVPAVDRLIVRQPAFMRALSTELESRPLEDWRAYLRMRVLAGNAGVMGPAFESANFAMNSALTGAREQLPRWQRCLRTTDGTLGDALGREYVKVAFTPDAKREMQRMAANLRGVLRDRLGKLEWMSEATRQEALRKLEALDQKLGYPEKWRSYDGLEVAPGAFVHNVARVREYFQQDGFSRVGKAPDRTRWAMTPPTVNAYYSPQNNEVAFPAGRVQPPFFHPTYDPGANYGGIGGTIGHEISHGFDDQGRQFDAKGNLRDWWTADDAARFRERADMVVSMYDAYTVLDSLHVNGRLTLGENIADIAGVSIAYEALERELAGRPRNLIDGFTPEQRFFLAYAQARRGALRPEQARLQIATDPHSPNEFRVNGPLSNMEEFARAFGCKRGDPMVRPDSTRIRIW